MTLTKLAKFMPYMLVRFMVKKFSRDFVTLKIGNKEIKGVFWLSGKEEGFFISDLSELKTHAAKIRQSLYEIETKIDSFESEARAK